MGANNSNLNSVIYCGTECQKQKKLKNLWNTYQTTLEEQQNIPNKVQNAKQNYYIMKEGPGWFNKNQQNVAKKKINLKKNKLESKISNLISLYKDKLAVEKTQQLLINKLRLSLNEKNMSKKNLLKSIDEIKNLHWTKVRQIELIKRHNNSYRINTTSYVILIVLIVILFLILILKIYHSQNKY